MLRAFAVAGVSRRDATSCGGVRAPVRVRRWPSSVRADPWLLGAAALLLYLLLGQHVLYGDGMFLLLAARQGHTSHTVHVAYLPLLVEAARLLAPLGWSLHRVALLLSQLGAAIGVGFMAAAAQRLALSRREVVSVAALVGGSASVLFFATVVELHGPFLAGVGVAAWAAARLAMRPTVAAAVLAGVASAAAFTLHGAGLLLPLPLLGLAWAWPGGSVRGRPARLVLAAAVHVALVAAVSATLGVEGRPEPVGNAVGLLEKWAPVVFADPHRIVDALWCEWWWPFLPLGLLWPWAARLRPLRPLVAVTVAALAAYMVATILVLGHANERGAYLQPLAFLFALLLVRSSGWRVSLAAAVAGCVLAVGMVSRYDSPRARAYADGYATVRGGAPALLLIADPFDVEACLVAMPDVPFDLVFDIRWLDEPKPGAETVHDLEALDARIAAAWAKGQQVWASASVLQWPDLRQGGIGATAQHLLHAYRLVPAESAGFRGMRLLPRPVAAPPKDGQQR